MTPTITSNNLDTRESSKNVVSLSGNGKGVDELIGKTAERIRLKIEKDRDKKTTLLDTSIIASWDSSEDINSKIHNVINTAMEVIFANPDIGAGNATIKLIKDCLMSTNPNEYIGIKSKLLKLTEYNSLADITDDDLYVILMVFRGKESN